MNKRVEKRREQVTFCTYKDLVEKFRIQSVKANKSMSHRIEEFMISELKKGDLKDEY